MRGTDQWIMALCMAALPDRVRSFGGEDIEEDEEVVKVLPIAREALRGCLKYIGFLLSMKDGTKDVASAVLPFLIADNPFMRLKGSNCWHATFFCAETILNSQDDKSVSAAIATMCLEFSFTVRGVAGRAAVHSAVRSVA